MSINRHNYEEYFILYMDNELDAEGRRAVEAFVQQHPDLKEELDLLHHYKLEPDTSIVFDGKTELMKINGHTPIMHSNYEEWMVLYIDNELVGEQKTAFEKFMIANPSLQQELDLLQRSKLQPEQIIFKDKSSLYRREEKTRPVAWWRIAAAAVLLLGIGISAVIVISNNKKTAGKTDEIVTTNPGTQKKTDQPPVVIPENKETPPPENIASVTMEDNKSNNSISPEVKNELPIAKQNVLVQKKNMDDLVNVPVIKEEPVVVAVKKSNDLPKPENNPSIQLSQNNSTAIANNISKDAVPKQALTNPNVTIPKDHSSDIKQASYTNPQESDVVLDQPEEKKNRSRGLFRKIARTFEKRTNVDPTDDNRLLVAGLAIKLK